MDGAARIREVGEWQPRTSALIFGRASVCYFHDVSMGESRPKNGFGFLDFDVEDPSRPAFGELDWDLPGSDPSVTKEEPPSSSSASGVKARDDDAPPPSRDPMAQIRELYASGDAAGALAVAEQATSEVEIGPEVEVELDGAPISIHDRRTEPPPSYGEPDDSLGGLIPVDIGAAAPDIDVDAEDPVREKDMTRVVPAGTSLGLGSVLGSLTERQGIPRLLVPLGEVSSLPIDHRAGFLLGFIDGMQTMEEILDVCAMPPSEAIDLIRALVQMKVITIE